MLSWYFLLLILIVCSCNAQHQPAVRSRKTTNGATPLMTESYPFDHLKKGYVEFYGIEDSKAVAMNDDAEEATTEKQPETAVIHIGPLKTGSTSIQVVMNRFLPELKKDGYEIPGNWEHTGSINMVRLSRCFDGNRTCDVEALGDIPQIAKRGSNILLSAEAFSLLESNIDLLSDTLRPWKNRIVVAYYRRYWQWLHSRWNQKCKEDPVRVRKTYVESAYTELYRIKQEFNTGSYTTALVKKWGNYFEHIKVYNMHDTASSLPHTPEFFCDAIPDANATCDVVLNGNKAIVQKHLNPSRPLDYEFLAYDAIKQKITSSEWTDSDVAALAQKIQERQEQDLGLTAHDFTYKKCPDEEVLQLMLEMSLEAEQALFPDFYRERGEREIREQFERDKTTILCSVDVDSLLQYDTEWIDFLKSV